MIPGTPNQLLSMLESYLELLLAVQEGDHGLAALAHAAGMDEQDTRAALAQLRANGFLEESTQGAFSLLPAGRELLRLGSDEIFKRTLNERLGGEPGSAS